MNALIYIVDDEPTVCGVTRRMLEQAGYTVQTMHTARRLLPRCVPNRRIWCCWMSPYRMGMVWISAGN